MLGLVFHVDGEDGPSLSRDLESHKRALAQQGDLSGLLGTYLFFERTAPPDAPCLATLTLSRDCSLIHAHLPSPIPVIVISKMVVRRELRRLGHGKRCFLRVIDHVKEWVHKEAGRAVRLAVMSTAIPAMRILIQAGFINRGPIDTGNQCEGEEDSHCMNTQALLFTKDVE